MADIPALQFNRVAVKRPHDRNARVRTALGLCLRTPCCLCNEHRGERHTNGHKPRMLHDLLPSRSVISEKHRRRRALTFSAKVQTIPAKTVNFSLEKWLRPCIVSLQPSWPL